jgi:hypothetical protein
MGGSLSNIAALVASNAKTAPLVNASKIEKLPATIPGQDVKRTKLVYGPFKLKAANSKQKEGNGNSFDPEGSAWSVVAPDFPTDITVLSARMSIFHPDGKEISPAAGVYTHHAFFFDASKGQYANIKCPSGREIGAVNSIVGGANDAGGAAQLPDPKTRPATGNYIGKGNKVLVSGDLVNYQNVTKEVYMSADIQYVEGKALGLWETFMHLIAVGTCEAGPNVDDAVFLKPPADKKQFSVKGNAQIKDDGRILAVRGHMHGE